MDLEDLYHGDLVGTPPDFYEVSHAPTYNSQNQYCMPCSDTDNEVSSVDNASYSEEEEEVEEEEEEEEELAICKNCRRKQIGNLDEFERDVYGLQFSVHIRKHLKARHFYRSIIVTKNGDKANDEILLCHQCSEFLSNEDNKEAKKFKNIWPGYMWKFLSDQELNKRYGRLLWCFIPYTWRRWWIESMITEVSPQTDLYFPTPFFVDWSLDRKKMNVDTSNRCLSTIGDTTNELLIAKILYPGGSSEYIHVCGTVPFDIVIQWYLICCQ